MLTNFHQTNCWVSQVKAILNECNLSVWWQSHIGLSVKDVNEVITSCLFWVERDKWENNQTQVIRLYHLLKSEYKDEPYTSTVNILSHRSFLARLSGGTAPLAIETGRYVGVHNCHNCYEEVEDEIHILTSCECIELQRKIVYQHIQKSHPEFHHLTNKDKYICILHHDKSSSKTAENIFTACKCVILYNM